VKPDTLETLTDEELQTVIAQANDLLKARDRQRKNEAVEQARAILAIAGLNLRDVAAGKMPKAPSGKVPVYRSGHSYQHPSDKAKTWNAKGQKPNWVRELEAEGRRAVEVANDNIPPSLKKTG
jgi:hypothetical protein